MRLELYINTFTIYFTKESTLHKQETDLGPVSGCEALCAFKCFGQ